MGQPARPLPLYEQARGTLEEADDRAGVGRVCQNLGNCHFDMGQPARALPLYEQARAALETVGDRQGVSRVCGWLANCSLVHAVPAGASPMVVPMVMTMGVRIVMPANGQAASMPMGWRGHVRPPR